MAEVRRHLATLGLVVALGCTGAGCRNDVERALAAADAATFTGAYARAEDILRRLELRLAAAEGATPRRAAELSPAEAARRDLHVQVLGRLAELGAVQLHNLPQALQDYTALARLEREGPRAGAALRQAADLLRRRLDQPAQAAVLLRQAAEVLGLDAAGRPHPAAAEVRQELVATYVELGNYDAAIDEARALLVDYPEGSVASDARLRLGKAHFLAQHYREAAATFLQLVDAHPGRPLAAVALVEAGHAYQELGEPAQALTYYYAALQAHPNPLLVQDKVARVRARIYQLEANRSIISATGAPKAFAEVRRGR